MRQWDGKGLPPVAAARLERANRSGVRTSLLSVPSHLGVTAAGFTPVGEVMGCIVNHLGWAGFGGCGWMYGAPPPRFTITSSNSQGYFGFGPYVDAKRAAWNQAIGRMLTECHALGGDGVVGVRLEENFFEDGNREFLALGTAVTSRGVNHAVDHPFATTLSGVDLLKLSQNGYFPKAIVVALSVGIRHDDWSTQQAAAMWAGNQEVPGYTDLVESVRSDCRNDLKRNVQRLGAVGAILSSPMGLRLNAIEPSEGHRDHLAEASLVATTLIEIDRMAAQPPLSMLPLR